ncbi:MAG TPA: aminoglycoside phosphotransferase family protein [Trueperaceae bacterium]
MPERLLDTALPERLVDTALPLVGDVLDVRDVSWEHAESVVLVIAGSRRSVVVKSHRQRRKFEQELAAYTEWLPRLRRALPPELRTPELLAAHDEDDRVLVLSFEPGEPAEDAVMPPEVERRVYRLAGSFLGALHGLPFADEDELPLEDAYRQRLHAWLSRSEGVVPRHVAAKVAERVSAALPALAGAQRVRCHRDFTARNWLVGAVGGVVVIDFEHSRPDWRYTDLERLWAGTWRRRRDLREAFLAGYGDGFTTDDEDLLAHLAALGALSTVTWAREHGDEVFERHGWEVLAWLGCTG